MATTIHMAISILSWRTDFATVLVWSGRLLYTYNGDVDFQIPFQNIVRGVSEPFQACVGTAVLTVNVRSEFSRSPLTSS